ncbi:MAG: DUF4340 domain-containing protein [Myxococcota bacterium]
MIARFRGTWIALAALVVVLGVWWLGSRPATAPPRVAPSEVFRFEKEDLVGFAVVHPDGQALTVRQVDGQWAVDGQPWRPSRSMIRRVAHQLHDLDARADVVRETEPGDLARYGLGPESIAVTLTLSDGRALAFRVGDPNPTGVSWYLGVDDRVFVVKKSAMDFWRLDAEAYREDRITSFDADEATRIDAVVDGRAVAVERTGHRTYQMHAPVEQPASRDEVRMMLGRVSALRATTFVADAPADLARWSLDPPLHTIRIELETGEAVALGLGAEVVGADPPQRYLWHEQDRAVYAVKDGLLDSFRKPVDAYRDRDPIRHQEWDAASMVATQRGVEVALTRSSDGWRWPGGGAVSGSTPKRVAERASGLRVISFEPAEPFELDPPWATVSLTYADGATADVVLGRGYEVELPPSAPPPPRPGEPPPPPAPRTEARRIARITVTPAGGAPALVLPAVEVDGQLAEVLGDLFREHGRKRDRDAEKRLDEVGLPD